MRTSFILLYHLSNFINCSGSSNHSNNLPRVNGIWSWSFAVLPRRKSLLLFDHELQLHQCNYGDKGRYRVGSLSSSECAADVMDSNVHVEDEEVDGDECHSVQLQSNEPTHIKESEIRAGKGNETSSNLVDLMIYSDPSGDESLTYWGLNVKRNKFYAYVNYALEMRGGSSYSSQVDAKESIHQFDRSFVTKSSVEIDNDDMRSRLRSLWKESRLITDKTDVLAVYRSDLLSPSDRDYINENSSFGIKRGGFSDMIAVYTDRMRNIVKEEDNQEETKFLMNWLRLEYGEEKTNLLQEQNLLKLSRAEQFDELQTFMDFFREKFPYYHDRCAHCGASTKDEKPSTTSEEDDDTHFVGYVYPSNEERQGKAARTEIYLCKHCDGFTRFPRYNSVIDIIRNKRGRCGEYAMLLYRILKCLGHQARWIVDWSDHVWAEILLPSDVNETNESHRWIHLDPCEAAVDKPYLYQEWGKKQTYIIAFCQDNIGLTPPIEDVTQMYTTDNKATIAKRRQEPEPFVAAAINSQIERIRRQEKL